jgi:hypothetical protein
VLFSSIARQAQINDLTRLELAPFEVAIAELRQDERTNLRQRERMPQPLDPAVEALLANAP